MEAKHCHQLPLRTEVKQDENKMINSIYQYEVIDTGGAGMK